MSVSVLRTSIQYGRIKSSHVTPFLYELFKPSPGFLYYQNAIVNTCVEAYSFAVLSTLSFNSTIKSMDDHYQHKSVIEQAWMDWDFI